MDFMDLSFRLAGRGRADYLPYALQDRDAWPEAERVRIHERVLRLYPAAVGGTYNNWVFSRHAYGDNPPDYHVRQASWESTVWTSRVLDDLLDAIDALAIDRVELVPEDAVSVTAEQALAEPLLAGRSDNLQHDREMLADARGLWMVRRPHLEVLFVTYDDPGDPRSYVRDHSFRYVPWHERNSAFALSNEVDWPADELALVRDRLSTAYPRRIAPDADQWLLTRLDFFGMPFYTARQGEGTLGRWVRSDDLEDLLQQLELFAIDSDGRLPSDAVATPVHEALTVIFSQSLPAPAELQDQVAAQRAELESEIKRTWLVRRPRFTAVFMSNRPQERWHQPVVLYLMRQVAPGDTAIGLTPTTS